MARSKNRVVYFCVIALILVFVLVCVVLIAAFPAHEPTDVHSLLEFEPHGAQRLVFGRSGRGRELVAWRFGRGENVLLMTFCIHGFEDSFPQDGAAMVYTANRLMEKIPQWDCAEWSIYIVPCANPDGLINGTTENGAGRCTTSMYLANGVLTDKTGVDINRCFPVGWEMLEDPRYFNGSAPLACAEAQSLAGLLESAKGEGMNFCIDVHGWYQQILTSAGMNSALYKVFSANFPECSWADVNKGTGYFSAYAAVLGYEACLFEFPADVTGMDSFAQSGYIEKFIESVKILTNG